MAHMDMDFPTVDDRIESDGHYATVRFVGQLLNPEVSSKSSDVIWIGVEWDDPNRGKHNGSFKGVQYFKTSHPTSGSFLRREKCNTGVPYMLALARRYGSQPGDTAANDEQDLYVLGRNQQTAVTAVGLDRITLKQSQFENLRSVSVRGMFVSSVGNADEIEVNSVNLHELDISLNLLSSFEDVAKIVGHMMKLKSLNVSENRLTIPKLDDNCSNAFAAVQSLFANHVNYDWESMFQCLSAFPSLENVHACYNRIEQVTDILTLLCSGNLRLVNLEGNPIDSWEKVILLGQLPQLQTLILNDCKFSEVSFPGSCSTQTDLFPCLESLSICGNQISDWSSFNHINRLRVLTSLRFARNPLPPTFGVLSARQIVIAKISGLKCANGAIIPRVERQDAEVSYMLVFGPAWKAAKGDVQKYDQFTEIHPRYDHFTKLYGAPEDCEIVAPPTSALKNDLITVRIETKSIDQPPLIKQLPAKMTIQKLKTLVQRAYRVSDPTLLRLVYFSKRNDRGLQQESHGSTAKVELDNDMRELSFYSVEDGAIILAEW